MTFPFVTITVPSLMGAPPSIMIAPVITIVVVPDLISLVLTSLMEAGFCAGDDSVEKLITVKQIRTLVIKCNVEMPAQCIIGFC